MPPIPRPTDAELAILRVLWARGPSTVREVHTDMADTRTVAYTTTLKLLQVMTAKGLVTREARGPQHIYRARHSEQLMQRRLVRDLVDRAFGGSTSQFVLQALASRRTSPGELDEIRRLLDTYGKDTEEE
ncbi:MAG: transcriptional regulator [Acidobacteria bacterium SCN 69-37]|nr:MAG: transcriptional regulator [Acidobacteria bacterium SCN 69-37]